MTQTPIDDQPAVAHQRAPHIPQIIEHLPHVQGPTLLVPRDPLVTHLLTPRRDRLTRSRPAASRRPRAPTPPPPRRTPPHACPPRSPAHDPPRYHPPPTPPPSPASPAAAAPTTRRGSPRSYHTASRRDTHAPADVAPSIAHCPDASNAASTANRRACIARISVVSSQTCAPSAGPGRFGKSSTATSPRPELNALTTLPTRSKSAKRPTLKTPGEEHAPRNERKPTLRARCDNQTQRVHHAGLGYRARQPCGSLFTGRWTSATDGERPMNDERTSVSRALGTLAWARPFSWQ